MTETTALKPLKTGSLISVGPRSVRNGYYLDVEDRSYLDAMVVGANTFGEEWRTARTYNGTRYLVKLVSGLPLYHRLWSTNVYQVEVYGVESGVAQGEDGRWGVTLTQGKLVGAGYTRVDGQSDRLI